MLHLKARLYALMIGGFCMAIAYLIRFNVAAGIGTVLLQTPLAFMASWDLPAFLFGWVTAPLITYGTILLFNQFKADPKHSQLTIFGPPPPKILREEVNPK